MTKLKRTPWYPANIKPVRIGRYEYSYQGCFGTFDCWWDGLRFTLFKGRFKGDVIDCYSEDKWRGLAAKP